MMTSPPLVKMAEPGFILIAPPPILSRSALRMTFSRMLSPPTFASAFMVSLRTILLCALKVRVESAPAVLVMVAPDFWVIFPNSSAFGTTVLVSRMTLFPRLRALLIINAKTTLVSKSISAAATTGPTPASMVISAGSINQVPPLPFVAEASAELVRVRCFLPDVSIKPPSPETAPPLAVICP